MNIKTLRNVRSSLFYFLFFFSTLTLMSRFSFGQEQERDSVFETLEKELRRRSIPEFLREDYDLDSGVISNFLEIYRAHFEPESQRRVEEIERMEQSLSFMELQRRGLELWTQNLEGPGPYREYRESLRESAHESLNRLDVKRTNLASELEIIRRNKTGLWDQIDRPKESSFLEDILSVNLGLSALGLSLGVSFNPNFPLSQDKPGSHFFHRRQQFNVLVQALYEDLETKAEFERLLKLNLDTSNSNPELSKEWALEVRREGGVTYFKDENGVDRQFSSDFLIEIESSPGGSRLINIVNELMSKSSQEITEIFPEYRGLIQNENFKNLLEKFEEQVRQNPEKIDEHLLDLTKQLVHIENVLKENEQVFVKLHRFLSPPTSLEKLAEQIEKHSEKVKRINGLLENSSVSPKKRDELQKEREEVLERLGEDQNKQAEVLRKEILSYVEVGTQVAYFLANVFDASPKTKRAIAQLGNFAIGSTLVITSSIALAGVNPPIAAVGLVLQGISMMFGLGSESQIKVFKELLQKHTEVILKSLSEHTQIILENQKELHRDLKEDIYDSRLSLSTDIQIASVKIDFLQRHLYRLQDFLTQSSEKIREDVEGIRHHLQIEGEKTRQLIWDQRVENYLLKSETTRFIQGVFIHEIWGRASGFGVLFDDSRAHANQDMISCREDIKQCTENADHQMKEIRKTMGELAYHIRTTLRSETFSSSFDLNEMQRTQIASYLSEGEQNHIEDRMDLFPALGKWLNSHLKDEENQVSIESLSHLSHPRLFPFFLDKYVELGLYLPQNLSSGRSAVVDEGMDSICKEALKQREASREMRRAVPLAWKVYRQHLSDLREVYSQLKERYKEAFAQEIRGEKVEIYLDPLVSSPLFLEEDFIFRVKEISDPNDLESGKRIPKNIDVFLEDLLFLSEDKIKVFVENMNEKERSHLADRMKAYVYREERQRFETKTCQVKAPKEVQNAETTFPNGKENIGEGREGGDFNQESLSNDFWIPQSFLFNTVLEKYSRRNFNCESKGEGDHTLDLYKRYSSYRYKHCDFCFLRRTAYEIHGLRVNYTCEKNKTGIIYDAYGNNYSGETWEVQAEVEKYLDSNREGHSYEKVVMMKRALNCNTCSNENKKRCTSNVNVSESGKNTLRFFCGWHKPRRREVCQTYKEGDLIRRISETNPPKPPQLPDGLSEEERKNRMEKFNQELIEFNEELTASLVEKIKDLRKSYLTQFQKQVYSYFSGEKADFEGIAVPREVQDLVRGLSLAKLSLVNLIYGGFGKALVENSFFNFLPFLKRLPSGYGPGMTLLKLSPESSEAEIFSFVNINSFAFKEWISLMEHEFHLPRKMAVPREEDFIFKVNGREFDLSAFLGFGHPSFVNDLLFIAARSSNLMMSEECLRGFGFSFHPEVVKAQFPALVDSSPEVRREMAVFIPEEEGRYQEENEGRRKRGSLLKVLARDVDASVRLATVPIAGQLGNREGFEILRLFPIDLDPEVKLSTAQTAHDLGGVKGAEILEILSWDADIEIIEKSISLAQDRALALTGIGEGEDSLALITSLSEMSANGNEEAWVLLRILFYSEHANEHAKSIEESLIERGLLKPEKMKEGEDFYSLLKDLLDLGSIGRREAVLLFDLFVRYRKGDKEARIKIAYYAGELSLEITKEKSLFILNQLFEDEKEEVRAAVAEALGKIEGDESLQMLTDLMRDKHFSVRLAVARGAGRKELEGEEGLPLLRHLVQDKDKEVRRTVVEMLGLIEGEEADRMLRQFVGDEEVEVRASLLGVLGERKDKLVLQVLSLLSGDSDLGKLVFQQAVQRGGEIEDEILIRLTWNTDLEIRKLVLQQAIQKGGKIEADVLRKLVFDTNLGIRKQVVQASAKRNDKIGIDILKLLVNDPDPDVRSSVVEASVDVDVDVNVDAIEGEVETQILKPLSGDRDWRVRRSVAYVLGEKDWKDSEEFFGKLVRDPHPKVRRSLARSAGKRGGKLAIEILTLLANDEKDEVTSFALLSAGKMENQEGAEVLKPLEGDSHLNIRDSLIYAAIEMGGQEGLEIVLSILDDDYFALREFLSWIERIGGEEGSRLLSKLLSLCDLNTSDSRAGKEICLSLTISIVEAVKAIGGGVGIQFLRQFVGDDETRMKMSVAAVAGEKSLEEPELRHRVLDRLVNDIEWRVRELVAYSAGGIGGDFGFQLLDQLAKDSKARVRKAVAKMSSHLEEENKKKILMSLIADDDVGVKVSVIDAAATEEVQIQILNDLIDNIDNESEDIRLELAKVPSKIGGEKGVKVLMKLTEKLTEGKDFSLRVRRSLISSAGHFRFETGVRILIPLLKMKGENFQPEPSAEGEEKKKWLLKTLEVFLKHEEMREFIAQSAWELEERRAFQILSQFIEDPNPKVRVFVVWSAGKIGGNLGFQILDRLAEDSHPSVVSAVALSVSQFLYDKNSHTSVPVDETLGGIEREDGIHLLGKLLSRIDILSVSSHEEDAKISFLQAAARIGGEEGFGFLRQFVHDSSDRVRSFIAQSLGNIKEPRADFLFWGQLVGDSSLRVKLSLIEAALKKESAVKLWILNLMARDDDPEVRVLVAQKLKEMEEKERNVILPQLSGDGNWKVRAFVRLVALEIGGQVGNETLKEMGY